MQHARTHANAHTRAHPCANASAFPTSHAVSDAGTYTVGNAAHHNVANAANAVADPKPDGKPRPYTPNCAAHTATNASAAYASADTST